MVGTITEKAISEERCGDADADVVDVEDPRERGLAGLVAAMRGYTLAESHPMVVPGPREIAEKIFWQLRCIEMELAGAREALKTMGFTFDWQIDDLAVERDAGLKLLEDAEALIHGLRVPLRTWLGNFGNTRLVELDREMMEIVKSLAASIPDYLGLQPKMVIRAAVEHLVAEPRAPEIIARSEQSSRIRWDERHGHAFCAKTRNHWPWTQESGEPWPTAASAKNGGPTAKGHRRSSRGANSTASKRLRGSGRKGKAA